MEPDNFPRQHVAKRRRSHSILKTDSDVGISIPGLERLANPSYGRKGKIMWLILLICCAVACIYLTVDRLVHFLNVPVAIRVEIKRMQTVTFPAFTICSNNLIYGLKTAVRSKLDEECRARNISNCESLIETIPFRDLNVSLDEVFDFHALKDIELDLMGMNEPLKVEEYFSKNKTAHAEDYQFMWQNTYLGSCIIIKHTGAVPYLSTATQLKVTIQEQDLDASMHLAYYFIPHDQTFDEVTGFEFLTHEFEIFKAGYNYKVKLHEQNFHLENLTGRICYDDKQEVQRMRLCARELVSQNFCRLKGFPDIYRDCNTLSDLPNPNKTVFLSELKAISENCPSWPICNETQHIVYVDLAQKNEKQRLVIRIRMIDDTINIVDQYLNYTFPDLVSDLFAYWGFFLNLSALVFAEIFEFCFQNVIECIKKRRKNES